MYCFAFAKWLEKDYHMLNFKTFGQYLRDLPCTPARRTYLINHFFFEYVDDGDG